ncbi:MAG: 30S ribosomal protein S6 [Candidatus Babeliales bacterium]
MERYEVLILAIPEITSDETSTLEKEFQKIVQQHAGNVISYERWGKLRLAFPIKRNDYGIYFLSRFEVSSEKKQELLAAINALFAVKYNHIVARYMTCALNAKASLEYQRPDSVEDVPTRDVGQFLRDNKMDGLLSPNDMSGEAGLGDDAQLDYNSY